MYKKLKKLLSTRQHVLVESVRGFAVVSMDYLGSAMIRTMFCDSIDMAKTDIALSDVDENECNNWQIIDVFDTPKERFKVGDEVVCTNKENYGTKGVIADIDCTYKIKFKDGIGFLLQNKLSYPFKEKRKPKFKQGDIVEYNGKEFRKGMLATIEDVKEDGYNIQFNELIGTFKVKEKDLKKNRKPFTIDQEFKKIASKVAENFKDKEFELNGKKYKLIEQK
jgi:hypothetical protein